MNDRSAVLLKPAVVGVLALLLATAAAARADESRPTPDVIAHARELNDRGRAAHEAGNYADAIAAFKEAYVIAPSPGVLFNLAQAYRLGGDCRQAVVMYRLYLSNAQDADNRDVVMMHLATVERCVAAEPIVVEPPKPDHAIPDHPAKPNPVVTPIRVTPPTISHGTSERRAGAALAIGGGILLATSLYFAIDASNASEDVSRYYTTGGPWSAIASTDARGHSSASWAEGLALGGGAALVAGGALYVLGYRAEHASPIELTPTAHGFQGRVSWQF